MQIDHYNYKHGLSDTPEFQIWAGMIKRCENTKANGYENYGGRGIRVCPEWRADFLAFYRHVGPKPSPQHSIDRIDNNRDYEPGNVRWATWKTQARNKRGNHRLQHDGLDLTVAEWAERTGIPYRTILTRMADGWEPSRALTEPSKTYSTRHSKGNNRMVEWDGRRLSLKQWADETGLAYHTLRCRLNRGWRPCIAFTKPVPGKQKVGAAA